MHDARWQPVWAVVGGLSLCALVAGPQAAVAQACAAVAAEVEALVRGSGEPELLLEIARDLGPRGTAALIVRAEAGDATAILALPITEASAKRRAGPPDDDDSPDAELDTWAGVVPLTTSYGEPIDSPGLRPGIPVSASIRRLLAD